MLPLLVMIQGCGMTSKPPIFATDTYCRLYWPVCYSHQDTPLTISQTVDNEVAFQRTCPTEYAVRRQEVQQHEGRIDTSFSRSKIGNIPMSPQFTVVDPGAYGPLKQKTMKNGDIIRGGMFVPNG